MADQCVVIVRLHDGKELTSSPFKTEEEAQADHKVIAGAMQSGAFIELPWITINGGNVQVVQVQGRNLPRGG